MGEVGERGSQSVPYRLPMFPLSTVLFPLGRLPLHVFEPRYRQMTAECLSGNGELGVVLIARGREVGGGDQRVGVGTVGRIDDAMHLPDGRWLLSVAGRRRLRVVEWLPERPYPVAMVEDLDSPDGWTSGEETEPAADLGAGLHSALSAVRRVRALLAESGGGPPMSGEREEEILAAREINEAGWLICDAAPLGDLDRQHLLETSGLGKRLDLVRSLSDEVADDLVRMMWG